MGMIAPVSVGQRVEGKQARKARCPDDPGDIGDQQARRAGAGGYAVTRRQPQACKGAFPAGGSVARGDDGGTA